MFKSFDHARAHINEQGFHAMALLVDPVEEDVEVLDEGLRRSLVHVETIPSGQQRPVDHRDLVLLVKGEKPVEIVIELVLANAERHREVVLPQKAA